MTNNPLFMNKEDVDRLCKKSYWLSKSKWRWRKTANQYGLSWQEVESHMDKLIEADEKWMNKLKEMNNELKGNQEGQQQTPNGSTASGKSN